MPNLTSQSRLVTCKRLVSKFERLLSAGEVSGDEGLSLRLYITYLTYVNCWLGRPAPDMADLCFTADSFFFFFSPSDLRARWTELNEKAATLLEVSAI